LGRLTLVFQQHGLLLNGEVVRLVIHSVPLSQQFADLVFRAFEHVARFPFDVECLDRIHVHHPPNGRIPWYDVHIILV
jgi:hypothetical protein